MAMRVVVFVDYQNAYRRARDAFHNHNADPYSLGQFHPASLGALLTGRRNDPDRQLQQVRMYRGMPDGGMEKRAHSAARRQVSSWTRDPLVSVTTRPLRYPRNYPAARAQEKGIDVQIALDFAMMAVRNEYDVGILMSGDTDLHPALEEVMGLGEKTVEVATWNPLPGRRRFHIRLAGLTANMQPYCHWIDHAAYLSIQDETDYTLRRR